MHVSVIIPAFNAAPFIRTTLRSVAEQTFQDYEVIVVDDASTDATAAIVSEAAALDRRIKLLRIPHNQGPAAARNMALHAATGTWLALLDADDCFKPERLERLTGIGENSAADLVSDNILVSSDRESEPLQPMYSEERIPSIIKMSPATFVWENTREGNRSRKSFGFMKPIIRRDFLLHRQLAYNTRTRFGEDFLLYVTCLLANADWRITPEPLYIYTVRANTLTDNSSERDLAVMSVEVRRLIGEAERKGDTALAKALRHHKRTIDHWRHNRAFKTAFNQSDLKAALHVAFSSRDSLKAVARDITANTVLKPFIPWIKRHFAP